MQINWTTVALQLEEEEKILHNEKSPNNLPRKWGRSWAEQQRQERTQWLQKFFGYPKLYIIDRAVGLENMG